MKRTIYIADDEENIRNLMKLFLINGGYEVSTFETGDELLNAFMKQPADLVILDVMMPGTDGLTLCSRLRAQSTVFIIIVSARDSELDRITGITLGSDDYLAKPFSPMELVVRVNALFRRMEIAQSSPPESLSFGNLRINTATRQASVEQAVLELTPTEYALMVYLLKNSPRAVSREELLKNIWNYETEVDTRAVDDAVKRLRKKLAATEANFAVESVWGFGFKLSGKEGSHEND